MLLSSHLFEFLFLFFVFHLSSQILLFVRNYDLGGCGVGAEKGKATPGGGGLSITLGDARLFTCNAETEPRPTTCKKSLVSLSGSFLPGPMVPQCSPLVLLS